MAEINEPGLSRPKKKQVDADGNPTLTRNAEAEQRDNTTMRTTIKVPVHVYSSARKLSFFEHVSMKDQFQKAWCEYTNDGAHLPVEDEDEGESQDVLVSLAISVPKWLNKTARDFKEGTGVSVSRQFSLAWQEKYDKRGSSKE